jgi:hypothetical protein
MAKVNCGTRSTSAPVRLKLPIAPCPGTHEGDLLLGSGNSALATLVERTSRLTLLVRLPNGRSSEPVLAALRERIVTLPHQLVRSLTWDQGKEMALHAQFTVDTGLQIYICDPRSLMAAGHEREHQRPAPPVLPEGHQPQRCQPGRARRLSPRSSTVGLDKPSAGGHPVRRSPRPLR